MIGGVNDEEQPLCCVKPSVEKQKPLPIGALSPPLPHGHALMFPAASSAAKAEFVDAIETKPLPVGPLLPP